MRSGAAARGVLSGSTGTDVSAAALRARAPRLSPPRRAAEREGGAGETFLIRPYNASLLRGGPGAGSKGARELSRPDLYDLVRGREGDVRPGGRGDVCLGCCTREKGGGGGASRDVSG